MVVFFYYNCGTLFLYYLHALDTWTTHDDTWHVVLCREVIRIPEG